MALDGCGLVCKYILIIFNIIFAVVGFALLVLGLWLRFSESTRGIFEIEALNSSTFVVGVTVLIALGSVMLIVVLFGDYGACNENRCSLQMFSALVAILAVAEVVCGVLAWANCDEAGKKIEEFYTSMYVLYVNSGDPAIAVTLTFIHKLLHCCGVTGFPFIEKTCPKPDGFIQQFIMPTCPGVITDVFNRKAPLVMGLFLGTGALLIIALICSSTLAKKIRLSVSSPQYIILSHSTPVLTSLQSPLHPSISTTFPNQDPVVFTHHSAANTPVALA